MTVLILTIITLCVFSAFLGFSFGKKNVYSWLVKWNNCDEESREKFNKYGKDAIDIVPLIIWFIIAGFIALIPITMDIRDHTIDKWRTEKIIEHKTITYDNNGVPIDSTTCYRAVK